eukprot:TRINITY_DN1266_c0_g1_i2.p1 TRINITY_DN1266_c0_g1~~TRINITY_DN1266_c0_g1_i2.p1  ORF type:complete len:147 (+),score=70.88 TRINITY_DN1266_c0_g1_i2:52-492(+)
MRQYIILSICLFIVAVSSSDYGIDVSNWDGVIDWQKVKYEAGKSFAFMKATEGTTFKDKTYATNKQNAVANGIKTGAYHFFHPGTDAIAQANFFIQQGGCANHQLPPVLDIEVTDSLSAAQVALACLLYTSPSPRDVEESRMPSSA